MSVAEDGPGAGIGDLDAPPLTRERKIPRVGLVHASVRVNVSSSYMV